MPTSTKKSILIILSVIVSNYCSGQVKSTYFGGCGNENVYDVEITNNALYIVGNTNSFGWGDGNIMVLKNNGVTENSWVETIRNVLPWDAAIDMQIINDSSFVFLGYYHNNPGSPGYPGPFIIKMDSGGSIIWSKLFDQVSLDHSPVKVIVTRKNELLILALASPYSDESCFSNFTLAPQLITLSDKGEIIQSRLFYIGPNDLSSPAHDASDIIYAKDSGYIITGHTNHEKYPYILKTDNELNPIWYRVFKYDNWIQKTNNIVMVDDGYIILGQDGGKVFVGAPFLLKVDFDGNLQWFKLYRTSGNNEFLTQSLTQYGNCLYFTAARRYWYSGSSADYYNYIAVCTNLDGDILWSKEIGDNQSYNIPEKIISYNDTLYLVGSSNTNDIMNELSPWETQMDIEFIKIDTTPQYMSQLPNIEFQITETNLDTLNYPIQFCDHRIEYANAMLSKKNVSFEYDSVQCRSIGIREKGNSDRNGLKIYPNPCSTSLFVDNEKNNEASTLHIQLLDIVGKVMLEIKPGKLPCHINLDNLEKGIYILKVNVDNQITIKKIIKN